jgi:hypothetical protein
MFQHRLVNVGSAVVATVVVALFVVTSSCAVPTVGDAVAFVARAEAELLERWIAAERAAWVRANFITEDTTLIAAEAEEEKLEAAARLAREAARFDGLDVPDDVSRKLMIIKTSMTLPAPADAAKTAELAEITTALKSAYGAGEYCPEDGDCLELEEMENILATSRDPDELLELWTGWRTVSVPMRSDFSRYVELANEGAHELGFADTGVRHGAGRVRRRRGPHLGTGQAAVRRPPLLRPRRAGRAVRRGDRADRSTDSGPPAGQHVGAGLAEDLRARAAR